MTQIPGKLYSILLPIVIAVIFTVTLVAMHRPLLSEILVASAVVSLAYLVFTFICLYFNIGAQKSSPIEFSDVPGLTKKSGWFDKIPTVDLSGLIDLADGGDHPGAIVAGFILAIVVVIVLPIAIAVTIFLLSGGIEFIVFAAAVISYFSFYRILRYQLTKRKAAKFNIAKSLGYSLLFTVTTVGLVPLGLLTFIVISGKT